MRDGGPIGIRKVLGAGVADVILIIAKAFILISISFAVAIPVTYYVISRWLTSFIDKITIGPVTFIVAGVAVLVVAWLPMSFLSYRSATSNPTKALRNE